jgi:hypothetical protein
MCGAPPISPSGDIEACDPQDEHTQNNPGNSCRECPGQVTIETIEEHFARLEKEIENGPAAFIFNADELGFQEFVGSREVQGIVPDAFEHDSVPFLSNRSEKRAAIFAEVSADRMCLKRFIIIQEKIDETDLFESSLKPQKMVIAHRERGFLNRIAIARRCAPDS